MSTHLADRIIAHYEKHAVAWDRDRQSAIRNGLWNDKGCIQRFVDHLSKGANVLDLGCGSGRPVAQYLVGCGLRVTGIDASSSMITLCRERLPREEWIVGDMRGAALGRRFQGIIAWDSFFHLRQEDQAGMFHVFAVHASEDAYLLFNTGPQHGEAISDYRGDPLYHASLSPSEYQALLAASGFEVVYHQVNDAESGGRTVWLSRRLGCGLDTSRP